jgi:hypothetical protein
MASFNTNFVVDGYTSLELEWMAFGGTATARCAICGEERDVEPDAENLTCTECGALAAVTSPLVKAGLI